MFNNAPEFNGNVSSWNVSTVSDMRVSLFLAESLETNPYMVNGYISLIYF